MAGATMINAYIGTYTRHGKSQGIYLCHFDHDSGALEVMDTVDGITDPSYLTLSPDRSVLYAASEKTDASEIHTYRVGPDGRLSPISMAVLPMKSLCHLSCHPDGGMLVGSGYRSGNLMSLKLNADGTLGTLASVIYHEGCSIHPIRQTCPHVHSAVFAPDGRHVLVCDLGTDRIYAYSADTGAGTLADVSQTPVAAGEGPRHMAFSPDGKRLYAVTELGNHVLTYAFNSISASLVLLDTIQTLKVGFAGESTAADIHLSPDGRFLYVSNRGADDITCFALDAQGLPRYVCAINTEGKTPRHFVITADGAFAIAANQDSDSVVVLKRNLENGACLSKAAAAEIPSPSCVLLL